MGRGDSGVHWDDWMEQTGQLYPTLGTDDAHGHEDEDSDTYQGWTMVRVKEATPEAILEAIEEDQDFGPQILRLGRCQLFCLHNLGKR